MEEKISKDDRLVMTRDAEHTYPNPLAACDFLNGQGWKISKSLIYRHVKEKRVRPTVDGVYSQKDLLKYASKYLRKKDGTSVSAETERIQQQKASAETRKINAQAELQEIKAKVLSGAYVPKDLFERELAARAAVFRGDAENYVRGSAGAIISAVEGNPLMIEDLVSLMMEQVEVWMSRYSAAETKFRAPLSRLPDDDDEAEEELEEEE